MPTPTQYKELERKLEMVDGFRNVPKEELEPPWNSMDADIEFIIVTVRLGVLNAFLREHSTVQFLSVNQKTKPLPYGHCVDARAPCTVIHGKSLVGINFLLRLTWWPNIARYLITCDWRESVELIATAPGQPYIDDGMRSEANPEGFVRLAKAIIAVDHMD
jgi:hypothetical protein